MIKYSSLLLAMLLLSSGCGGGGGSSSNGDGSPLIKTNSKVVINEVLADNNSTNINPDSGTYSDWIELKNITNQSIDISGYGLSDSSKKIKWHFPSGTTIGANQFLLIWADDFNSTTNPNPTALHASFKLKSNDDKVVLFNKSNEIIDELNLKDYKVAQSDISISRNAQGDGFILTTPPTPNAQNSSAGFVLSDKPDFSLPEGVYSENPLNITITAQNGAEIYYTTDGTDATINSPHAPSPIKLNLTQNKTTLKAIAKEVGNDKLISKEKSKTFVIAPPHSVVINEIFADNNSTLADDYKKSDWIELYNQSNNDVDLGGYTLSDSKKIENSTWKFPVGTILAANSYMVIFADDQVKMTEPFHSDFKLSDKGDSVVLYNDNNQIIDFKDFGKLKGVSLSRQGDNNFTKTQVDTPMAKNTK